VSSSGILERLMEGIDKDNPPKPCDYFDLIGGTSTGGLIAIMLGRLRMTIKECRDAYMSLSKEAFQAKNLIIRPGWSWPWRARLQARFDTAALERGIRELIVTALRNDPNNESKSDEELAGTLLKDVDSKCKVYV
jgi:patatin-like phospholipase/acyl hydrolase